MKHGSMRINQLRMTVTNIYNLLKLVAKEIYETEISKKNLSFLVCVIQSQLDGSIYNEMSAPDISKLDHVPFHQLVCNSLE